MEASHVRKAGLGGVLAAVCLAGLIGCDYWPPALQTEIEQLRSELQAATMEKTQLQSQVTAAMKARDDLQAQVDELSRVNREKTAMLTSLQHQLAGEREKSAKLAKATAKKPAVKTAAKPPAKATTKTAAKKKTSKTADARRH